MRTPSRPLAECHILVTPTSFGQYDASLKSRLAAAVGRVTWNPTTKPLPAAALAPLLADVDGFIAGLDAITADVLEAAPRLCVVSRYGVGVDNVDLEASRRLGIIVTNTPGANAAAVAELAIALILGSLRPIAAAMAATRAGGWPRLPGFSLEGRTVGLVGLGAIGRAVAKRLAGFNCRVVAYDPALTKAPEPLAGVCTLLPLPELLAQSDIVSLHLPALESTARMVNADFLAAMKEGSFLINTSRGELVDEGALLAALQSGHLAGAALDAFQQEPPGADNPLVALSNVIATPHMGAHTDGATSAMGRMALEECLAVLSGQEPAFRVI
jgi:phosphoglycerate dehydrogenase-like enzyme